MLKRRIIMIKLEHRNAISTGLGISLGGSFVMSVYALCEHNYGLGIYGILTFIIGVVSLMCLTTELDRVDNVKEGEK